MNPRSYAVFLLVAAVAAWWVMRDDPEADVRRAHADLAGLLGKTEADGDGTALLETRYLAALFAENCELSGDAGRLAGVYSPEELAATALRMQALFVTIEVTFGELSIAFPDPNQAVVHFGADLTAVGTTERPGVRSETRSVVSRMTRTDGSWQFVSFELTAPGPAG